MKDSVKKFLYRAAIAALGICTTAYAAYALHALVDYRNSTRDFYQLVRDDEKSAGDYNVSIAEMAINAPKGLQRTVAEAWAACAQARFESVGGMRVANYPQARDLDACEITSVQLAAVRGYQTAEASPYAQELRARTERALTSIADAATADRTRGTAKSDTTGATR